MHSYVGDFWSVMPPFASDHQPYSRLVCSCADEGYAICHPWGVPARMCRNAGWQRECYPMCPALVCDNQRVQKWTPRLALENVSVGRQTIPRFPEVALRPGYLQTKRELKKGHLIWPLCPIRLLRTTQFVRWCEAMWIGAPWPPVPVSREHYPRWAARTLAYSGEGSQPAWSVMHSCFANSRIRVWDVRGRLIPILVTQKTLEPEEIITVNFFQEENPEGRCRCTVRCSRDPVFRPRPRLYAELQWMHS
jgi:hypothetical protein